MALDRTLVLLATGLMVAGCSNDWDAILPGGTSAAGPGAGASGPASASSGGGGAPTSVGNGGAGAAETGGAPSGSGPGGTSSAGGQGGNPPTAECGNGVREDGEECDAAALGNAWCNGNCEVICDCPAAICMGDDTEAFEDPTTNHCYYLSMSDAPGGIHRSRDEAEEWCVSQWGGHLASIETEVEYQTLLPELPQKYSNEYLWLSAREPDDFTWLTGAPFSLQAHWVSGEPGGGPNDCLVIDRDGGLRDVGCGPDGLNHHICERVPPGTP